MIEPLIDQQYLKSVLRYDPGTGGFTWRERPKDHFKRDMDRRWWNSRYAGKPAGSISSQGYVVIGINPKMYRAHRLAYLYMTGTWPASEIDHINLVKHDNRWANLRESSSSENQHNRKSYANNTSGFKGVSWNKNLKKWSARIKVNRRTRHLGYFKEKEQASAEYQRAALELHGNFANF